MAKQKNKSSIEYLISKLNNSFYNSYVNIEYGRATDNYSSKIINEHITSIDIDSFINNMTETLPKFSQYIADRLFRIYKFYDKNNWELTIESGYYGDEHPTAKFTKMYDIISDLFAIKDLSQIEQILYILNLEYGYILPVLQDKTTATIISISPNEISQMNELYYKKIDKEKQSIYNNYTLPTAICIKHNNGYRMLDGYHRTVSAIHNNIDQIEVILLS